MSRPVNLNNVNISISEFQKLSSGTYNAGEVRLASESKLTKINNHVSSFWRSANKVAVSHEEVLAIKNAFVRALEGGGVGKDEINNVRAQLGLRPDGSADKTLAERSVKPLSRQQIREILDKNAATLNATIGGNRPVVRTSDELYARVGREEQARRAGMRADVAASTAGQRSLDTGSKIALFQDVLAGNIQFITEDEKEEMLDFALRQRDLMMNNIVKNSGGKPDTTGEVMITCTMDNGSKVNLFAGRSEAELLKRMDDVVILLRTHGNYMSDDEAAVHREFLALDPADRLRWLDEARNADGGAFMARTVTVAMLAERGVGDAATLSHVNDLSGDEAFALAKQLAGADPELRGDALRANPIVTGLVQHPVPGKGQAVPNEERAFVPTEMTTRLYNWNVVNGLGLNSQLLPSGFVLMATEVRAELTRRYGEKVMPPGTALNTIAKLLDMDGIITGFKERNERITPESIRDAFFRSGVKSAVDSAIRLFVEKELTAAGMDRKSADMAVSIVKAKHPELAERLAASQSKEETDAICAEYKQAVHDAGKAGAEIKEAQGMAMQRACEALAAKLGVSTGGLTSENSDFTRLELKASKLALDIADGKAKLSTKAEYEKAFCGLADEFVAERTRLLDEADTLDMPQNVKDAVKVVLLTVGNVKHVDIAALAAAAKKIDASGIVSAFNADATDEQIYAKMEEVTSAIRIAVFNELKHLGKIGPDDSDASAAILTKMVVGSQPGLDALLKAFYDKPAVVDRIFPPRDGQKHVEWQHLMLEAFSTNPEINMRYEREAACLKQLIDAPRRKAALASAFTAAFNTAFTAAGASGPVAAEAARRAAAEGYHVSELPMLVKAFSLYKGATGCSDEEAIKAALDPRSVARRLLDYGGRFTESVEQFKSGLALIDKFEAWYAGLHDAVKAGRRDGLTLLNFAEGVCNETANRAVERFLFEEIAINKDLPLDAKNPEEIFGMANNPAMRFVGRGFTGSFANSLAQIPPEKRQILYAVFDVFMPVPATKDEKKSAKPIEQNVILASRVLKHLDELAALKAGGEFDRAHLVPLLYPDLSLAPDATNREINDAYEARINANLNIAIPAYMLMAASGATVDEATAAINESRRLPSAPFMANYNGHLAGLDGTVDAGRKRLLGDMLRASLPIRIADKKGVLPSANVRFHFNFADGERLVAKNGGSTDKSVAAANEAIVKKIESLCGKCHSNQLSSIYFTLSQSGAGSTVRDAFIQQGIKSDEHMALSFSLEKNDETGTVVVTISEPPGFPVRFHWTSSVALDGTITSTPMEIEKKV